jgi:hypothetical protein
MTDWLSVWSKERRKQNRALEPFTRIYMPYGVGRISSGDRAYCVGIEGGDLHLFTRVDVRRRSKDPDPTHINSVLAYPKAKITTNYNRPLPRAVVEALEYLRVGSSSPCKVKWRSRHTIEPQQFRGPASLRELVEGAPSLDALVP